jgi:cytochrome P450
VIDLADPAVHATVDLTAYFRRLRAEEPVFWQSLETGSRPGFWVITRHEDAVAASRDSERFTSVEGNVLATLLSGGDPAGQRMLAVSDGPRHAQLRKLLHRAMSPAATRDIAARIHRNSFELVARAAKQDECDFAGGVAANIPLAAVCDLLGVPEEDRDFILRQTSSALSSDDPHPTTLAARLARNELLLYFARLARTRRDPDAQDIVSLLKRCTIDAVPLTEEEVILNCYSVILGGDETTRLALISAVIALAENPAQWEALREGAVAIETAVEEMLRWSTPALHVGRTVRQDTQLRGRRLRAGDAITLWIASANRDEREFERPDELLLDRQPNRHLTFAYGPHFCLGAQLARIEMTALLKALLELVEQIEIVETPRRIFSNFLSGYSEARVRLHARAQTRATVPA